MEKGDGEGKEEERKRGRKGGGWGEREEKRRGRREGREKEEGMGRRRGGKGEGRGRERREEGGRGGEVIRQATVCLSAFPLNPGWLVGPQLPPDPPLCPVLCRGWTSSEDPIPPPRPPLPGGLSQGETGGRKAERGFVCHLPTCCRRGSLHPLPSSGASATTRSGPASTPAGRSGSPPCASPALWVPHPRAWGLP